MKFKDFKKFVDENTVTEIEISNNGEIFLNPELIDIIKYANEKNITLTVYGGGNGNAITDEMAEALVKYQVRSLLFSLDGASQEVYSIYRRGGDFNKVIANIKKINEYKAQYKSQYPELGWKYIIFGHNVCDMLKAKKMAADLGMYWQYSVNFTPQYSPIAEKDKEFVQKELSSDKMSWDLMGDIKDKAVICDAMFNQPQISFDGQLLGCCCNQGFYQANVFKQGLKKALNSADYLYAKKMLAGKVPEKQGIPCTTCHTYKMMKEEGVWLDPNV